MKRLLLILVCISLFMSAFGQSFVLKGIVSSADGELLPGVNVKIQGTTVGTITDITIAKSKNSRPKNKMCH